MNSSLLTAAMACFAFGVVLDICLGVGHSLVRPLPYLAGLVGSGCLVALGARATTGALSPANVELFGLRQGSLRLDPLSGFFLTLLFALAVAISACFAAWASPGDRAQHRGTASGYLGVLGSVTIILLASNAFVFLFAWESLTVAFYVLTSVTRSALSQLRAAWLTGGTGRLSGAALLLAFLLLATRSGSLDLATWGAIGPGGLRACAWALLLVGFGAKLGIVPFEVWVPIGYPAAPGPSRAVMAGMAANVGIYGLWRFLGLLGPPPAWLVVVVLLTGGATALLGITFAAVQGRLSRVVSYSSVENAGLIITAYGVALAGAVTGLRILEALGLLAATLQTVAHAVAKTTLFCSLANMEVACGTDDLELLRGVGRKLKWSGASFGAGAVALAGLPPTVGFVSEWFILEALMQQFRLGGLELTLALAAAGASVALTTGLAAITFLRVLGITILGARHRPQVLRSGETGVLGKAALSVLGAACLGLAAAAPWEIRYIADGLAPVVPAKAVLGALKSPWVLQPVFKGFSILSPSWLWVAMPVAASTVFLVALVLSRGGYARVRLVPAWHSAAPSPAGPSDYSAFAFANPLRHVLGNLLGTRRVTGPISTGEGAREEPPYVETHTAVAEPVETYVYKPLGSGLLALAKTAKRLQSGRLNSYVAYMFVALLAALALVAALR
jgi:hydrogenase-4 component B